MQYLASLTIFLTAMVTVTGAAPASTVADPVAHDSNIAGAGVLRPYCPGHPECMAFSTRPYCNNENKFANNMGDSCPDGKGWCYCA